MRKSKHLAIIAARKEVDDSEIAYRDAEIARLEKAVARAWGEGLIAGAQAAQSPIGRFVIMPKNPYRSES